MKYFDKNEIEQYNRDGFLVKTNFYDEKEISEIRRWVYDYSDKKPEDWEKGQEMGY